MLTAFIAGIPRPQPRPRVFAGRALSIASRRVQLWRARVVETLKATRAGRETVNVPCHVVLAFFFRHEDAMAWGSPHERRPDADNIAKLVMDALMTAGVIRDDSLVAELKVSKRWSRQSGVFVGVCLPGEDLNDFWEKDSPVLP